MLLEVPGVERSRFFLKSLMKEPRPPWVFVACTSVHNDVDEGWATAGGLAAGGLAETEPNKTGNGGGKRDIWKRQNWQAFTGNFV